MAKLCHWNSSVDYPGVVGGEETITFYEYSVYNNDDDDNAKTEESV